ncbi:methionine ABC transporter substrate-binding protein [Leucobacter weissii]|uniref:Methionine ABC transporter substrate-binding protein n=1 Tax=Leucobacter weissii TaxID=1983706 RepID=A0A939SAF7_9MICO|nr:MetQ/NlpA family ABC transporter substrate-binding protein [Leucobacter weissii]MBO1901902.1 methionine ABC transporter substrate-binding protein [Leucobacter weissii]
MSLKKRGSLAVPIAALALALTTALAGCATPAAEEAPADETPAAESVKLGVVGASDPYWEVFVDAAAEEGIEVELVDFSDYNLPNPALTAGEIDLNQFQHIIYLAQHNNATGDDLQPIGSTAIYPLGLYSTQFESVEDIPDGATVAVPSDETNRARGLLVLQSAGLIALEGGGSVTSTPDDIIADQSRVEVTELDAALTATSLGDVAAAIINNDFVPDAGLEFSDAIAQDDPSDPAAFPYINIFASRAADKDNPTYLKLVEIYQNNQDVLDGVQEVSGNTAVFTTTPAAELQESLAQVQSDIAE